MNDASSLTALVREYQRKTGEETLTVLLHNDEQDVTGIHDIGYEPLIGLLVDGKPPTSLWFHMLEGFIPLQQPPQVLH